MQTTWRVTKVEMTEGKTEARLVRVEWFKQNPAYTELMDEYEDLVRDMGQVEADLLVQERDKDQPFIDEWLDDVQPGDEGADFVDAGDSMTIDITGGLELRPGDNVMDDARRVGARHLVTRAGEERATTAGSCSATSTSTSPSP